MFFCLWTGEKAVCYNAVNNNVFNHVKRNFNRSYADKDITYITTRQSLRRNK